MRSDSIMQSEAIYQFSGYREHENVIFTQIFKVVFKLDNSARYYGCYIASYNSME